MNGEEMLRIYRGQLTVKVIGAASVEEVYKSLRHHPRRYPAVIVNHMPTLLAGIPCDLRRMKPTAC